jgi:hypothetical protein
MEKYVQNFNITLQKKLNPSRGLERNQSCLYIQFPHSLTITACESFINSLRTMPTSESLKN